MNWVPTGAGISIPEWELEAPDVGAFRFPKNELMRVYPGKGQTNPSGLKSIISEFISVFKSAELEYIGMKNMHIKIVISMRSIK